MIPILTASQIREADAYTIKNEPVASADLMERAAQACTDWLCEHFDIHTPFTIVCGQGNNGGDGLAIARILLNKGFDVEVVILRFRKHGSDDFEINLKRLQSCCEKISFIDQILPQKLFSKENIIIDAIFGTGLNKPTYGLTSSVIHQMNTSGSRIISIDIPSGMFSEGNNKHISVKNTVCATETLTFQFPKLAFLLPDSGQFAGNFTVLDIGLDQKFVESLQTSYYFLNPTDLPWSLLQRNKFSHKGNFGHSLLISGSKGKTGAAVLASEACLRAGSGLLTVQVPGNAVNVLQTAIPEAMVTVDPNPDQITQLPDLKPYSAIGIGPGIGTSNETAKMLKLLIQNTGIPLVIDADALNILAENKTWLSFLPAETILTPHPGEFERLFGKTESHFDRIELQRNMSFKYNIIIVLKGAHTAVSFPDGKVIINSSGNPGMATAGSGDVLTGIITGLYAQTRSSTFASLAGVFLHGAAGDIAFSETGLQGMLAGDIIKHLPEAFSLYF